MTDKKPVTVKKKDTRNRRGRVQPSRAKPRAEWLQQPGARKGRPKPPGSGRKMKQPPASATPEEIRLLAADGHSIRGIAARLGTSNETFTRWMDEDKALREAFEAGREEEGRALRNVLYRQATEKGNIVAAMFILKCRHGWDDRGNNTESSNKVSITFQLPGAMQMQEFKNLEKVIHDEPSNPVKRISK